MVKLSDIVIVSSILLVIVCGIFSFVFPVVATILMVLCAISQIFVLSYMLVITRVAKQYENRLVKVERLFSLGVEN